MAGPPPDFAELATQLARVANHPPVTAAVLQQQVQQQSQHLQQQLQQQSQQLQQQLQQQIQQQFQQQFQQLSRLIDERLHLRCVRMSVLFVLCSGYVNAVLCCSEARQQARMTNSLAPDETALEVILDANGAAPPHWPAGASSAQVRQISGSHINQVLQFYHLSTQGTVSVRRRRVLKHLGVRI